MTDTTTDTQQAGAEVPKAEFVSMEGRTAIVPLKYPIRFNGIVYSEIPVRRITGAEMAQFVNHATAGGSPHYPGVGVPREVYEALDADDATAFNRVLSDFFPQALAEESERTPET